MRRCILLIQPSWSRTATLVSNLQNQGFAVHHAENIAAGETVWKNYPVDVIVLTHEHREDAETLKEVLSGKIPVVSATSVHLPDSAKKIVGLLEEALK